MAKKSAGLSENAKIGLLIGGIVLILGFVVMRVLGALRPNTAAATTPPAPIANLNPTTSSRQNALGGVPIVSLFDPNVNPFRVTVNLTPSDKESKSGSSPTNRGSAGAASNITGEFPGGDPLLAPLQPGGSIAPVVRLSGVVVDSGAVAYVVRNEKAELLSIGDEISGGFKIIEIRQDGIRVRKDSKTVRILVGQFFNGISASSNAAPPSGLPQIEPETKKA